LYFLGRISLRDGWRRLVNEIKIKNISRTAHTRTRLLVELLVRLTAVEMCAQNYYKAGRRWCRAASKYKKAALSE
jgi:hypothetical protein